VWNDEHRTRSIVGGGSAHNVLFRNGMTDMEALKAEIAAVGGVENCEITSNWFATPIESGGVYNFTLPHLDEELEGIAHFEGDDKYPWCFITEKHGVVKLEPKN
jgi:hypothetical protein